MTWGLPQSSFYNEEEFMNDIHAELMERLKKIAHRQSKSFCYGCYKEAPSGRCESCHSDDLMRFVPEVGVDWGCEWVIKHLVEQNLAPADLDEAFESSIESCYPEKTLLGWMEVSTIQAMKDYDRVSWDLAQSEWVSVEEDEGHLISFDHGASYFWQCDLERYIEENESET